jgi:hypothetical protein
MVDSVRLQNAKTTLQLASDLQTDYQSMLSAQTDTLNVQTTLETQLQTLRAKKKDLETGISTYEQDFLEKRSNQVPPRQNFQTLQDMVLAIFFVSYILISLIICTYVSRVTNSILFFLFALFVLLALGVVLAQIIIRYA